MKVAYRTMIFDKYSQFFDITWFRVTIWNLQIHLKLLYG